jgi:protease-4
MGFNFLLDRRRLKRHLNFWRILAILAIVILAIVTTGNLENFKNIDHIAAINISNIIIDDPKRSKALLEIAQNTSVKALVVRINSPGGTVVGGESLYLSLRHVAKQKPVVAIMGDLATSAGYMTAIAADHIFARKSTVTGSIGVIMQTANITQLLENIGIKPEIIKSSPLKAQPNPLEPMNEQARIATQAVVTDMFNMFIDMVVERRKIKKEKVRELADGRIYTGRQAHENGLIDAIGGEKEALNWLYEIKNINRKISLRTIKTSSNTGYFKQVLDNIFEGLLFTKRLRLDGFVALWQPTF